MHLPTCFVMKNSVCEGPCIDENAVRVKNLLCSEGHMTNTRN